MPKKLHKTDLYFNGAIVNLVEGNPILTREPREYIESKDDRIHYVVEGETLDFIAYTYYLDSKYWHYIADINKIFNPFLDLLPGSTLIIPTLANY
jgi:hypothetical protein